MARNQSTWQAIDKWTLLMVVALAVFGWMNISGACYTPDSSETFSAFDFSNFAGKQFVWILTSTVLALIILIIDRRAYEYFAYILYAIAIVALMITPIVAQDVKGSLSFLTFGPIRIQPAEFSKFIIALTLAKYMGRDEYQLNSLRDMIIPALIILVPMFIIMIPHYFSLIYIDVLSRRDDGLHIMDYFLYSSMRSYCNQIQPCSATFRKWGRRNFSLHVNSPYNRSCISNIRRRKN